MAITLETLAVGDTNYISKHNNNYATIKSAIDALQLSLSGAAGSVTNFPTFAQAVLGTNVGRMSETGALASDGGSALLDITAGSVWVPSAAQVRTGGSISLDFTGQSTGTYYTHIDSVGAWSFDTNITDAVHTISFTAPSTFSSITQPRVAWGNTVFMAAKDSAFMNASFEELDDRLEAMDSANSGIHSQAITTSDVTLTDAQALQNQVLNLSGTLTGDRNLNVPDGFVKWWIVRNNTGGAFNVTVKTVSGTGVVVPQGGTSIVMSDGTNVLTLPLTGPPATQPFVISTWRNNAPISSERMIGFTMPSNISGITLAASAAGSSVESEVAATAQTDFDLQKNSVSIGTIRFAAAGQVATFVGISETTFTAGDTVEIIAPATPDATLADIFFTIYFSRDNG